MSRFALAPEPAEPSQVGDGGFIGLDMKTPRDQLQEGFVPRHENRRFIRGSQTRPGTRTPIYANQGFPSVPFIGSGLYSNPTGREFILIATAVHGVYAIASGTLPQPVDVVGASLAGPVEFSQHYGVVLLHQSDPTAPTQVWDGASFADGFAELEAMNLGNGIVQIPNAPWSISFLGRNVFPIPRDENSIGMSDVPAANSNGYDIWDSDLHKFAVNLGVADRLVGLYAYGNTLFVGRSGSIGALVNVPGDLGDSFLNGIFAGTGLSSAPPPVIQEVSTTYGFKARKCVLKVGREIHFLSDSGAGGIYRIVPSGDQSAVVAPFVVDPTPLSEKIEPLIQRINWAAADGAVARQDGIYSFFAVPIDDSPYNNAMIVRNNVTGQWEGLDHWDTLPRQTRRRGGRRPAPSNPMEIDNLIRADFYGRARLHAINNTLAKVHLLYEGSDDQLNVAGTNRVEVSTYPIQDVFESRGYAGLEVRHFDKLILNLLTSNPSLTLTLLVDGSGDPRVLFTDLTRSRANYLNANLPAFLLDNHNDDFDVAGREDYSVQLGDRIQLQDGVQLSRLAPWSLPIETIARARALSVRLENTGGEVHILSIGTESRPDPRTPQRG